MGFEMSMGLSHRMERRLSHEQHLALKQLLKLSLDLRHPEIPEAVRGIEGIRAGKDLLRQRKAVGVLIGGLAERIWKRKGGVEALGAHKDVDIMVLSPDFSLEKDFEGGIDWWLPETARLDVKDDFGSISGAQAQWWKNANGTMLHFGAELLPESPPGLYIPGRDWILNMREYEAEARIGPGIEVDGDVLDAFTKKLDKGLGRRLMREIVDEFGGHILDPLYEKDHAKTDAIRPVPIERSVLRAIRKYEGESDETAVDATK